METSEMMLFIGGAVLGAVVILVFVGLELYRRGRDDDQYKEVAQEVAMGLRQAYVALGEPIPNGRYVERINLTRAILDLLMAKARSITGPEYEPYTTSLWEEAER